MSGRENYPDVDYYDCTGRHGTRETHPFDATRFIACENGRANDMACPDCPECEGGHQRFDLPTQTCEHTH